jgi:periplasmic protein TonB
MTNKEILQADVLDILFENRNKTYGAYALRKTYNQRLHTSLAIALGFSLLLLLISFFNGKEEQAGVENTITGVVVNEYEIPEQKKPDEPRTQRSQSQAPLVQNVPIVIASDDSVPTLEVPTTDQLQTGITSTVNRPGVLTDTTNDMVRPVSGSGAVTTTTEPQEFHPDEVDAKYPGGKEAFAAFLAKHLITPDDLELGEKRTVIVRFMVDVDGSISKTEVVETAGERFDKEVMRVLRKMPKWIPAQQNGRKVATYFTQPVIFQGVEQ